MVSKHNWRALSKKGICTYFAAIFKVAVSSEGECTNNTNNISQQVVWTWVGTDDEAYKHREWLAAKGAAHNAVTTFAPSQLQDPPISSMCNPHDNATPQNEVIPKSTLTQQKIPCLHMCLHFKNHIPRHRFLTEIIVFKLYILRVCNDKWCNPLNSTTNVRKTYSPV